MSFFFFQFFSRKTFRTSKPLKNQYPTHFPITKKYSGKGGGVVRRLGLGLGLGLGLYLGLGLGGASALNQSPVLLQETK